MAEQEILGVISCTMDELYLLRKKLLMVHRHPTLYRILALGFLCITILLMFLSVDPLWPGSTRAALFILSLFSLMLSLSYFHLGNQEERGY